jgi:stage III sporulation protein AB
MIIKIIGAVMIVAGCSSVGFLIATAHKREVKTAQQLILALEYFSSELRCRLTPLPELCRETANVSTGIVKVVFHQFANELEQQICPNTEICMGSVLDKNPGIPSVAKQGFLLLGRSVGRFDVEGQLKDVDSVCAELRKNLQIFTTNQEVKLRSYQTLGLCAGAAIAILFL